jgi:hypothetical protein
VFHDGNCTPVTITEVTRKRPFLGRVVHDTQPLIVTANVSCTLRPLAQPTFVRYESPNEFLV